MGHAAGDERRFRALIPERYAFFEGHFPSYPVLAGIVQLHELVLPCARLAGHRLHRVRRLRNLKFLARIVPGDEVDVLVRTIDGMTIGFEVLRGTTLCSTGRLDLTR
jgi:3-hydroxymyristoyl/3-hydroxydecanoyl-(acyl carrier protein) dehydratase